ncbi:tail fiber assembly protein, partial [Escherichia coli]|nr:tail fiber assembly protein [Escherichia coli]
MAHGITSHRCNLCSILKNITAGNPKTVAQYQLTKNFDVIWLWSEDGKN